MSPILLYGCCIWGIPETTSLIYINNIPEGVDTRAITRSALNKLSGKQILFNFAKRIGKKGNNISRPILVNLQQICDKFHVLGKAEGNGFDVTNYDFKIEDTLYEKMHSKFLKFVLNVNKHSSNTAVRGELGRFPISAKAWALSIKYWHNIVTQRSPNILLISAMSAEHHSASSRKLHFACRPNTNTLKQRTLW